MKIIFMGTPSFAVPSLDILFQNGYEIVGVVTSVDKYGGRGRKQVIQSDVKKYSVEKGLPILQPRNLKNKDFIEELRSLNADLQFVVAFRMLPEVVWNMPPLGTYNLHASLLPAYRGAAPINWAIINGENQTGLTTFKLKHAIDTGDVAFQKRVPIDKLDTAGSLHDKLMDEGAELVLKTVTAIANNNLKLKNQAESKISKAPKIYHEDCELDFDKEVAYLYNFIRGLSPYPLAWMNFLGKKLKIYWAEAIVQEHKQANAQIISDFKTYLRISCRNGYLDLKHVQIEGKKRMSIHQFLNGVGSKMKTQLTQ